MSMQYVATRPAEQKQSVVGIVGLLMAMVLLVAMIVAAGFGGQWFALAVRSAGHSSNLGSDPAAQPYYSRAGLCDLMVLVIWALSFVPFILGIIGSRRRPRNMGITAIAVSVVTPIIGFVLLFAFMASIEAHYPK